MKNNQKSSKAQNSQKSAFPPEIEKKIRDVQSVLTTWKEEEEIAFLLAENDNNPEIVIDKFLEGHNKWETVSKKDKKKKTAPPAQVKKKFPRKSEGSEKQQSFVQKGKNPRQKSGKKKEFEKKPESFKVTVPKSMIEIEEGPVMENFSYADMALLPKPKPKRPEIKKNPQKQVEEVEDIVENAEELNQETQSKPVEKSNVEGVDGDDYWNDEGEEEKQEEGGDEWNEDSEENEEEEENDQKEEQEVLDDDMANSSTVATATQYTPPQDKRIPPQNDGDENLVLPQNFSNNNNLNLTFGTFGSEEQPKASQAQGDSEASDDMEAQNQQMQYQNFPRMQPPFFPDQYSKQQPPKNQFQQKSQGMPPMYSQFQMPYQYFNPYFMGLYGMPFQQTAVPQAEPQGKQFMGFDQKRMYQQPQFPPQAEKKNEAGQPVRPQHKPVQPGEYPPTNVPYPPEMMFQYPQQYYPFPQQNAARTGRPGGKNPRKGTGRGNVNQQAMYVPVYPMQYPQIPPQSTDKPEW